MLVRPLQRDDLPAITAILTAWFRELTPAEVDKEVDGRVAAMEVAVGGDESLHFFVAEIAGEVVGIAGLESSYVDPELFTPAERPVEAITVYVRPDRVGSGIGRALLDELEVAARDLSFTTLLVVSGARYRDIGYPFWTRRYGQPFRVDIDHWGRGFERAVWRMSLEDLERP